MKLNLKKNLCFFDVEATGLHIIRDRIIQIGMVLYRPKTDTPEEYTTYINPGIPISEEAMRITGITAEILRNKPTFDQVAKKIFTFIGDADLAGYNCNRFDIPILMEEFARVGFDFNLDHRQVIDVQRIFHRMEPRTLSAAHRFYCGEPMENSHDALADVRATANVLLGQLDMYEQRDYEDDNGVQERPIKNDVTALHAFSNDNVDLDVTKRLKFDSAGEIVFNFGKNAGRRVIEVFTENPDYYHWIMKKEFSVQVKKIVDQIYQSDIKGKTAKSTKSSGIL